MDSRRARHGRPPEQEWDTPAQRPVLTSLSSETLPLLFRLLNSFRPGPRTNLLMTQPTVLNASNFSKEEGEGTPWFRDSSKLSSLHLYEDLQQRDADGRMVTVDNIQSCSDGVNTPVF